MLENKETTYNFIVLKPLSTWGETDIFRPPRESVYWSIWEESIPLYGSHSSFILPFYCLSIYTFSILLRDIMCNA